MLFKNKYIMAMAAMTAMSLASCDLDEVPQDSISPDTYFENAEELELYTNQFYTLMPDADDLYDEASNLIVDNLSQPSVLVGLTRTVPASGGGWSWGSLRHINYYLENCNRCSDESARALYDGTAYFWRAWFYFKKLQQFGEVPIYEETIDSDDYTQLNRPRDSRDDVINFIIADCDRAIELLPETASVYKLCKSTARALKARACLHEGTFRKYHAGHTFNPNNLPWEDLLRTAAEAANEIITSGKYKLYTTGSQPYYDLFTSQSAQTSEVIFARCFGGNYAHSVDQYALSSGSGRAGLTKALVGSYLMKDGSFFSSQEGWETMSFTDECKNRDPRLAQTVVTQGSTYADGNAATFNFTNTVTGYPMLKFISGPSYQKSTTDMPIIRLAEIYLIYAEAKAELGTLTQDDLDCSINLLRDRVGMPHLNLAYANANIDPFMVSENYGYKNVTGTYKGVILEIRRERGIEMVAEGQRFQDLVRWREGNLYEKPFYGPYMDGAGKYDMDGDGTIDFCIYIDRRIVAPGCTPYKIGEEIILSDEDHGYIWAHSGLLRSFNEDRDYLYPIPINDRTLTGGILTQNPGWDDGLSF